MKPYCFVLMPFGQKSDQNGKKINFDKVYQDVIKPAVEKADLQAIRADEELFGGIIHKPMFERLMLCEYAVADLTTANANVFYELGIRHGIRPHSTLLLFADGVRLPFDVSPLRGLPYRLNKRGAPIEVDSLIEEIAARLNECRTPAVDSPLYQLVNDVPHLDLKRLKTDAFRSAVEYSEQVKLRLNDARQAGTGAIKNVEDSLGRIEDVDPAILVDLMLSYRAVKDWGAMIEIVEKMPPMLKASVMVREQLGFAYNRLGQREHAERVLKELILHRGASSETNGILGRVYKDWWQDKKREGLLKQADAYLHKAIECYLEGFESDWRDAYPGINAVTLMELTDPRDARQAELLPIVNYAISRRMETADPDYWDFASLLEISILAGDKLKAEEVLGKCLVHVREQWEPETTANNLRLIIDTRESRGEDVDWIREIQEELIRFKK